MKSKSKVKVGFFGKYIIPLARAVENNKLKAFLTMYAIWLVDLLSTAIALGLFSDILYEANPLAEFFMSFGVLGWIFWAVVCSGLIVLILFLPSIFLKFDLWVNKNKLTPSRIRIIKNTYSLLRLLNVSFVCIGETMVIINNITNLIGAL